MLVNITVLSSGLFATSVIFNFFFTDRPFGTTLAVRQLYVSVPAMDRDRMQTSIRSSFLFLRVAAYRPHGAGRNGHRHKKKETQKACISSRDWDCCWQA
jgi:hypothetical protein